MHALPSRSHVAQLCSDLGGSAYLLTDTSGGSLSPAWQSENCIRRFDAAWQKLSARFGEDFVVRGWSKRHRQPATGGSFVADGILSGYLLIIVHNGGCPDGEKVDRVLDAARPVLRAMIASLPPLDGGGGHRAAVALKPG